MKNFHINRKVHIYTNVLYIGLKSIIHGLLQVQKSSYKSNLIIIIDAVIAKRIVEMFNKIFSWPSGLLAVLCIFIHLSAFHVPILFLIFSFFRCFFRCLLISNANRGGNIVAFLTYTFWWFWLLTWWSYQLRYCNNPVVTQLMFFPVTPNPEVLSR